MAPLKDELSYSHLVKEAKRLDNISNVSTASVDRNAVGANTPKQKGAKVQVRPPRIIKHTKLSTAAKEENTSNSELKSSIIAAIREELKEFKQHQSNTGEKNTIYIPKDTDNIETHIVSETSNDNSDITNALEKLKKLKR